MVLTSGRPLQRQTSPLQPSRTLASGLHPGWLLLKERVRPSPANNEISATLPGGGSVPPRPLLTASPWRRSFLKPILRLGHSCCHKRVLVAAQCSPPYPRGQNTTCGMMFSVSPSSAACVCPCPPLPACVAVVGSSIILATTVPLAPRALASPSQSRAALAHASGARC